MKISFMLKREDFYTINRQTLERFYKNSTQKKRLYIYPELNAIVTAHPSRLVRQYLYTEFRVNGSFLKRLLVRLYAMVLLNSWGIFASKSITMQTDANRDTLIYPCNKKFRIFDFKNNQVSVIGKEGFPTDDLAREIAFRTEHTADFIPGLLHSSSNGYSEVIIDGCPVARTGERMPELCDKAYSVWQAYIAPNIRTMPVKEYADLLAQQIQQIRDKAVTLGKQVNYARMDTLCGYLLQVLQTSHGEVSVGLSHGDLQPGNIWVENGTDKIFVIDWESWNQRSLWYDRAVLYEDLRKNEGITQYGKNKNLIHATVLLEDIVFRLTELTTLPYDYGCTEFDGYIDKLQGGIEHV